MDTIEMPPVSSYVKIRATGRVGRVSAWVGPVGNPVLCAVNLGDSTQMCTAAEVERVNVAYYDTPKSGWYWIGKPNAGMYGGLVAMILGFLLAITVGTGGGIGTTAGLLLLGGVAVFLLSFIVAMIPRRRP